jgi:hypothetical protein
MLMTFNKTLLIILKKYYSKIIQTLFNFKGTKDGNNKFYF